MADSRDPKPRALPLVRPGQARLEQPTIMNRLLAAQYGAAYVQLAVFAIDIDRAYVELSRQPRLAFGWEVFVTQCYLLARIDARDDSQRTLIEDTCLAILEQEPDEQGYGSQLLFAVHDAIERGFYPEQLASVFQAWRARPKQLRKALSTLWNAPARELAAFARECLAVTLDTPLAAPTLAALQTMQSEHWPLPPTSS